MIGRFNAPPTSPEVEAEDDVRGFDDFELRLGDVMRGERATLGKSLLDVQRELKIKASYIAAIENSDPSAFETPGFVAGYVRSYARYLGMDPEWAFSKFCEESNFTVVHGLSSAASGPKPKSDSVKPVGYGRDPFEQPSTPFVPRSESLLSKIEPGALGSTLVLAALIGFIGYGGWAVLQEVQRVQLAPIDQAPGVTAAVDPLAPASDVVAGTTGGTIVPTPAAPEALDRLYRPQALEVPVFTARDAPISTLDPSRVASVVEGSGASNDPVEAAIAEALGAPIPTAAPTLETPPVIQVTEQDIPEVVMFASRPSWVRVTGTDGTVLFEKILESGEGWALPKTEVPPRLRSGNAGAVYFAVEGEVYGPAGVGASIVREVALGADDLRSSFGVAEDLRDIDVGAVIREAMARREAAGQ
jgi:cytoskeletal protein RodZ